MATLTMTVSRYYGRDMAFTIKEWFEERAMQEGDKYISLARAGLLRRWQLAYHIHEDTLTQEHYSFLLSQMSCFPPFLAKARFTTPNIGWVGLTSGDFTMTMKR